MILEEKGLRARILELQLKKEQAIGQANFIGGQMAEVQTLLDLLLNPKAPEAPKLQAVPSPDEAPKPQ